jgi:hypothetical protein
MAHFASHSIARMHRSDFAADNKADLQHRLSIAKMEARQDMEARIAKRVYELSNTSAIIRKQRNKDYNVAGYAMLAQTALFCAYIAAVCKFV